SAQKCGNPSCTTDPGSVAIKQCGKCKKTTYCSRECQTASWLTHKMRCRRPNYIIKFYLCPGHITNPEVVRTLSCPADAVFYHLHMVLQVAFGWGTTHSFDFAVKDPSYTAPDSIMEYMTQRMAL
ncbi:mynd domain-containing protein, partial [Diaporthe sp. PMI_573]